MAISTKVSRSKATINILATAIILAAADPALSRDPLASAGSASSSDAIDFYGKKITFLKVFGQARWTDCSPGKVDGSRMYHAAGVVVDRSTKPNPIYVVDAGNSRILGFKSADSKKADLIFGQPDEFSGAPNGDCNTGEFGKPRRDSLCLMEIPSNTNSAEQWMFHHLDVDSEGNLYVADFMNNRVLMYRAPFSGDKTGGKGDTLPDLVLGQEDYTSNGINRGRGKGKPDASSLYLSFGGFDHVASRGVSVDKEGNVWVADTFNFRVLRFPKGKTTSDLVLGQPDFTTAVGSPELNDKTPLDRMCTPTIARLNPDTGELFVVDEHPGGFPGRIMIFKAPLKNGMKADRLLAPKVPKDGDFKKDGYRLTHATGLVFNPIKTDDWTDSDKKTARYKDGVVWVTDGSRRTMLLDNDGNVLVVIGAPDATKLGWWERFVEPGTKPQESFVVGWPGGTIGFDSDNNIYLADGHFHRVGRFALPYRLKKSGDKVTLPAPNGGLCLGVRPNSIGPAQGQGDCVGVIAYKDQLILRDHQRYMVWNDYLSKKIGSDADLFVGQKDGTSVSQPNHLSSRSMHAIDHKDRLWAAGDGRLLVYQLPLAADSKPLREVVPFFWADEPATEVKYDVFERGFTFEPATKALWVYDRSHYRLLRVRIPDDLTGKFLVDAVIGQKNKTDDKLNHGMEKPDAASFGDANDIKFDHQGNLFVVDNTYELHANGRIIAFLADDLKQIKTMFPDTKAKKVYIASSFDEPVGQRKLAKTQGPTSPVCVAFNSKNEMIVGNDGYFKDTATRNFNQIYLYRKPLDKATPDAVIGLPVGAPGEICFDAKDNLIVQDHTYNKVWVLNFERDSTLLREIK